LIYFKKFIITGVANTVTHDTGLQSSKENPVRLLSVMVQPSTYKDNDVQGWLEREKIFELSDHLLDTKEEWPSNVCSKSLNRLNEIEVGHDIPVGATFTAALSCGASTNDLRGAYRYEIVGS